MSVIARDSDLRRPRRSPSRPKNMPAGRSGQEGDSVKSEGGKQCATAELRREEHCRENCGSETVDREIEPFDDVACRPGDQGPTARRSTSRWSLGLMPCRSICCAGHDDSSRDMLNGNGFATSRSPMSFEVFDIERGRWDSMLNWRTKVVVDFGSEATSSEGDRAGRPRAPLCKSHGCNRSRRCHVCRVADRVKTSRVSSAWHEASLWCKS